MEPQRQRHSMPFSAAVHLNPLRMSGDAGPIGQQVIQHLQNLLDCYVDVALEITAQSGPDNVDRMVTEDAWTLELEDFGFDEQ